jgi:hypothetical protein
MSAAVIKSLPAIIKAVAMLPYEIVKSLPEMVVDIGKAFYEIGKELIDFIGKGIIAAGNLISYIGKLLPKPSDFKPFNIADVGQFIVDTIAGGIKTAGNLFDLTVSFFNDFFTAVGNWTQQAFNFGGMIIQGIIDGILAAPSIWESVVDVFTGFIDNVKRFFLIESPSKLFAGYGDLLMQGLVGGMKAFGNVFDSVKGIFSKMMSSIGKVFEGGVDLGEGLMKSIMSGLKDANDTVGDLFSALAEGGDALADWASDVAGDIGDWLGFAKGGYTGDGNPNDIAGVVHKGEYVIPADQTKKMLSGRISELPLTQSMSSSPVNITLHNLMSGSIQVSGRELARIVMENIDSTVWSAYGNQGCNRRGRVSA